MSALLTRCVLVFIRPGLLVLRLLCRALMAPNPENRPTAEELLQSELLAGGSRGGAAGQPHSQQQSQPMATALPTQHPLSNVSTQTVAGGAAGAAAAGAAATQGSDAAGGGDGKKHFAGLVLQRSTAR